MDIFMEYMVKKGKELKDYLYMAGILLLALLASVIILYFAAFVVSYTMGFEFLLVAGAWYGAYLLIRRRNVEYEYIFTNGELDVDAIYAKRRRSHILTIRVRDMEICAPVYTDQYQEIYIKNAGVKSSFYAASSMTSRSLYFADFQYNGEKVRLLFEPPASMIEKMKKYNPSKIHPLSETEKDTRL